MNPPAFSNDFAATVAHEVGHTTGWNHESDSPLNRSPDGGPLLDSDGGPLWCGEGIDESYAASSALTALDHESVMNKSYCGASAQLGLTDLDIQGTVSVYGQRPETGDADGDGFIDLVDNCPYVANGGQNDSNFDAEVTVGARDNAWSGTVNGPEGHVPVASDPSWYKQRWHDWYKGDACDKNAVAAISTTKTYASHLQTAQGCWDLWAGGITSKTWNGAAVCPQSITDGRLDFDAYVSSRTGFMSRGNGSAKPVACQCPVATSSKSTCANPLFYNCQFARDEMLPPIAYDVPPYFRITQEWQYNNAAWFASLVSSSVAFVFQPPIPGYRPSTSTKHWNPFYSYSDTDTVRMGLGAATSLSAILWTHVTSFVPAPPALNLGNNYVGADVAVQPGTIFHWVPPFAPKWKPSKWIKKVVGQSWGPIQQIAISKINGTQGYQGLVIEQRADGLVDATSRFSASALSALVPVADGTRELLVGDDHVTGGSPFTGNQAP